MDSVVRAAAIFFVLLIIFRISGKRTLAQITTFDFVLLLIISEATQQAMIGEDFSFTNAVLVIVTLVGLDILMSLLTRNFPALERFIDGLPLVIVKDGKLLQERALKSRVKEEDVLNAARSLQGLQRMDQIKYAVLEQSGEITIVPKEQEG